MPRPEVRAMLPWMCVLALSCTGDGDGSDSGGATEDGVLLAQEHNIPVTGAIDLELILLPQAVEMEFQWSSLTTDMLGHSLDPVADVTWVHLARISGVWEDTLEQQVADGSMSQAHMDTFLECVPQDASCMLSDFLMFGADVGAVNQFQGVGILWMLSLVTDRGDGISPQSRRVMLLTPDPDSESIVTVFDEDRGLLELTGDLSKAEAVVATDGMETVIDWSGLTEDGRGNAISLHKLDQVQLHRYAAGTVDDLAGHLADVALEAEDTWSLSVEGRVSVELSELQDASGDGLSGLDDQYDWLLTVECATCWAPVPSFIGRIE